MNEENDSSGDWDEISDIVEARRQRQVRAAGKLMERLAEEEIVDRMLCDARGYHRVTGISEKDLDENVCYDCFKWVDKDQTETYRVVPYD